MIQLESIHTEKTSLFTAFPRVRINAEMQIIAANEKALADGIRIGEKIPLPHMHNANAFLLRHEAALSTLDEIPDSLLLQKTERFRIEGFHGFHLVSLSYRYSLAGNTAEAVLFRSYKEYAKVSPEISEKISGYTDVLEEHFELLQQRYDSMLADPEAPRDDVSRAFRELSVASLFSMRVFFKASPQRQREKRLFSVSSLLRTYLSRILPETPDMNCLIEETDDTHTGDLLLPMDTAASFLLLTILFRIMNEMSRDGRITVSRHVYGKDGEIRLSTLTHRRVPTASHISDFSALSKAFPKLEMLFVLADYLAGVQDWYLDFLSDSEADTVTVSLFLPAEKHIPDFKSPPKTEDAIADALSCLRGLSFGNFLIKNEDGSL